MKKLIIICATILFLAGCSLSGLDLKVDEATTDKASATVEKEKQYNLRKPYEEKKI